MNKLKYIWIVAAMIVALSACTISYKLNGAAIDYSIYKTINVGQFPIRAAMVYAPLQPMFENKLTDTYTKQTRLRIVDSSNTDLSVEGEITGYSLTPAGGDRGRIRIKDKTDNIGAREIHRPQAAEELNRPVVLGVSRLRLF